MNSASDAAVADQAGAMRPPTDWNDRAMQARIRKRYRSERNFRLLGLGALLFAGGFLIFLLATIIGNGWNGFRATEVRVPITFDATALGIDPAAVRGPGARRVLEQGAYQQLVTDAVAKLGGQSPIVAEGAWLAVRERLIADPSLLGKSTTIWLSAKSNLDQLQKGNIDLTQEQANRPVNDAEVADWRMLNQRGLLRTGFNTTFLTGADSTDPESAGIWGAAKGSFLTLFVTLALSFPIGAMTALYLEEFAPKNRWTDIIEVSINNLAAVPSIIFGLLGLAVFLNTFDMPRSAPIVGGLTLALMTLPVIVIAGRASIKAVPPSVRDAALGVGASRVQVVTHHVLPLALPGILTGTIIGMARALGETAPLLMIGMRAFLTDVPNGLTNPATVLPVQVYIWSDNVARGFVEKTSAAIIVLLLFLLLMNSLAIYLRNKFEVRW